MNDVATKAPGTTLTSKDFNATQADLENAVTSSDQTLDPAGTEAGDQNMAGKTMANYAGAAWGYTDSGSANAHVVAIASNLKAITKYFNNLVVAYLPGNINTSTTVTTNVSTLGVKNIRLPGGGLPLIGSLSPTHILVLKYNNGAGYFEIISGLNAPTIANFTNAQHPHENAAGGGVLDHNLATDNPTVAHGATGAVVGTSNSQTLTNKELTTPIIANFINAQHDHNDAAGGGSTTFAKVGIFTRDLTLASGAQGVTGVGFVPKVVMFFANRASTSNASWGIDNDVDPGLCIYRSYITDQFNDETIYSIEAKQSAANVYRGSITSLDSDGFTMTWVKSGSPIGVFTINYLAIR